MQSSCFNYAACVVIFKKLKFHCTEFRIFPSNFSKTFTSFSRNFTKRRFAKIILRRQYGRSHEMMRIFMSDSIRSDKILLPSMYSFQLDHIEEYWDTFVLCPVEHVLAVSVRRVILWVSWGEESTRLYSLWAVEIVNAPVAPPPTAANDFELSWGQDRRTENITSLDLIWLHCIVFIHFYSACHSMSFSEALPTTSN